MNPLAWWSAVIGWEGTCQLVLLESTLLVSLLAMWHLGKAAGRRRP